jgi:isoleucyl-tRNA synthetase
LGRITKSLAALAAATMVILARADEPQLPFLKEGLWESHIHQTSQGQKAEHTVKMCQTIDTQRQERAFSADLRQKNQCTYTLKHPSAAVYVSENRCQAGALAGTLSKSTMTYRGDTSYHDEIHLLQNGRDNTTVTDASYLGPCPADMKPGDKIVDDSARFNISDGAASQQDPPQ